MADAKGEKLRTTLTINRFNESHNTFRHAFRREHVGDIPAVCRTAREIRDRQL